MIPNSISAGQDPKALETISKVYGEEAERQRSAGQVSHGAELVRDVAAFKAQVQKLAAKRKEKTLNRRRSGFNKAFLLSGAFCDIHDYKLDSVDSHDRNTLNLATDMKTSQCRYIVSTVM